MGYPTDMTDHQWAMIEPFFTSEKRGKHFQKHSKRVLINAVLYLNKTGCHWRLLPNDFPPYVTVWSFYRRAIKSGLWDKMTSYLVEISGINVEQLAAPSYFLIDSQCVNPTSAADAYDIDGEQKPKVESAT